MADQGMNQKEMTIFLLTAAGAVKVDIDDDPSDGECPRPCYRVSGDYVVFYPACEYDDQWVVFEFQGTKLRRIRPGADD